MTACSRLEREGACAWPRRVGVAIAVLCLASCFYPDSSERFDDDLVFTAYKKETDFAAFKTFAIDPVLHVATVEEDGTISPGSLDASVGDPIISHLTKRMEDAGYRKVQLADNPDLGMTATAISGLATDTVSGGYYGGYYGSYWGFPGWSYYYPYSYSYSYRTGSLIVDLADLVSARRSFPMTTDPAEPDEGPGPGGLAVVWTMAAYKAFVDQNSGNRVATATSAIDQAFDQSPYMRSQ